MAAIYDILPNLVPQVYVQPVCAWFKVYLAIIWRGNPRSKLNIGLGSDFDNL